MDPLDLLTEDGWREVLERVKDPQDLKSCSEACLIFEEILRNKRNGFMFSLVLPKILEYIYRPPPGSFHFGVTVKDRQWSAMLKGRLVCKSWRESIDKLRDAECGHSYEHRYRFDSGEVIDQFLQKFATHSGNPFLGRRVTILLRSPLLLAGNQMEGLNVAGDPEEIFHVRKLRQLLERFGREIWKLWLSSRNSQHLADCKNVLTILGHLPNLRSLRLPLGRGGLFRFGDEPLEPRKNMAELSSYIAANPLPDLPHLENLETSGVDAAMMQPLLEKCANTLKCLGFDDPGGFPEPELWMCNLEELRLSTLDAGTPLTGLRQLQAPRLKSLHVRVGSNRGNVEVWRVDELFRNIQHLPIQDLNIFNGINHVYVGEAGPISADQRPSHGSISTVEVDFPSGSLSLNFLSYCPKMTSLSVNELHLYGMPRQVVPANGVVELFDLNELIQEDGYDLYQSNVWERIPSLESFRVQKQGAIFDYAGWRDDRCDRGEYERRRLENGRGAIGQPQQ